MTGVGAVPPISTVAVLGSGLSLLRRHALVVAILGAVLGVGPQMASLQIGYSLVLHSGSAAEGFAPLRAISGIGVFVSGYLSATALDVAVVAAALGRERRGRSVSRLVVRLLPVNLFCCLAAALAAGTAPALLRGPVVAAFVSWSILLPVFVAEPIRLLDLPRRGLALARRRPGPVVALSACGFTTTALVAADPFGFAPDYPLASGADLARAVAWSGAAFALQVAADAVFAALYLALRRDEGGARDAALASAFD